MEEINDYRSCNLGSGEKLTFGNVAVQDAKNFVLDLFLQILFTVQHWIYIFHA